MKIVLLPIILLLFISCSHTSKEGNLREPQSKVCKTVIANSIQEMGVKGMVCQMGCGGSIRKALKETCAVERVEVNYIDTLEEQTIKVYYNKAKISPQQMLHILANVNDKQFTVRTIGSPKKV